MRILFCTPQSPYPPHKGTSTRNLNLIKEVASQHEVHLLTFSEPLVTQISASDDDSLPVEARDVLYEYCATITSVPVPRPRSTRSRILSSILSSAPDLALRLGSARYVEKLCLLLRNLPFDLIQVEGLEMTPHWAAAACRMKMPPVVLDAHNCEYVLQRRAFTNDIVQPRRWVGAAYSFVQWLKLRRYEAAACRAAAGVVAVSEKDSDALSSITGEYPIAVVPNGVDTSYFSPGTGDRESGMLVFTGTMDFRPNVDAVLWFCHKVLPRIQKDVPAARFFIVGQRPKPEVERLAALPGVIVTGSVDDVRPYLWRASLCVVPLRVGGGTRFKILEAMATGTPVVSTTLGAEGIALAPGQDAALVDDPEAMAREIIGLLNDRKRMDAMAHRGTAFVAAHYDWRVIGQKMLDFYQTLPVSS